MYAASTGSPVSGFVISSTAFSMAKVTWTFAGDETAVLRWYPTDADTRCRWLILVLFRIVDIISSTGLYAVFWYGDQGLLAFIFVVLRGVVGVISYVALMKFSDPFL